MALLSRSLLVLGLGGVVVSGVLDARFLAAASQTVPVPVAAQTIPPFSVITTQDVTLQQVPKTAVHADDAQSPVGRLTEIGITMGSQIQSSALSPYQNLFDLAQARNGVLISVSVIQNAVSSMMAPGQNVNLLVNGQIIRNVPVLKLENGSIASSVSAVIGQGSSTGFLTVVPWGEAQMLMSQTAQVLLGNVPSGAVVNPSSSGSSSSTSGVSTSSTGGNSTFAGSNPSSNSLAQPPSSLNQSTTLPPVQTGHSITVKGKP